MGAIAYPPVRAIVLFYDQSRHWSRPFLKRGFRHVETALRLQDGSWVGICGKLGGVIALVPMPSGWRPEVFSQTMGAKWVEVDVVPTRRRCSLSFLSCVGVAKAVLGIRAPLTVTPWRLYRHLTDA